MFRARAARASSKSTRIEKKSTWISGKSVVIRRRIFADVSSACCASKFKIHEDSKKINVDQMKIRGDSPANLRGCFERVLREQVQNPRGFKKNQRGSVENPWKTTEILVHISYKSQKIIFNFDKEMFVLHVADKSGIFKCLAYHKNSKRFFNVIKYFAVCLVLPTCDVPLDFQDDLCFLLLMIFK
ncbi:unnamed protein product [Trichogramma brassicae]|uniref:Uncharacterized protein n=1 Tax=Trichogramma brassicae TaxID=86971 RepID=A0A6H5IK27_9HYME|nr:unnamed protein product [Trichogramma brassicae]